MKFNELSKKDIKYIKSVYYDKDLPWDDRMSTIGEFIGKAERTVRLWLVKLGCKESITQESEQFKKASERNFDKKKKRFIITWAQNNTPVHDGFFTNLQAYAKHVNASIHVVAGRYNNMTQKLKDNPKESWDPRLEKYLDANRHDIHKYVSIFADIKIQPTAVNPLASLESLSENNSCIVGHPRVHMKSLPVIDVEKPKLLFSTGSVTKPNFTDSRSGKIAEFHFVYGAVIVEIKDDEVYFIRQITADSKGDFMDLYYSVSNGEVNRIENVLALVKGDLHYGSHDEKILKRSFEELIPKIKPDKIVFHDIFDGISVNPHIKNLSELIENEENGKNSIIKEVEELKSFLKTIQHHNIVVVFSNHDDFLTRWINTVDIRKDPKNAKAYTKYAEVLFNKKAPNGLIPYIINESFPKIKCLGRNESYKIKGWEISLHGMDGSNGSRGNINSFRKLNTKTITAHGHGTFRFDGAVQVGTNSKLRLNYTNGPSNWVNSDCIIHTNGKSQVIIFSGPDREFTTFK